MVTAEFRGRLKTKQLAYKVTFDPCDMLCCNGGPGLLVDSHVVLRVAIVSLAFPKSPSLWISPVRNVIRLTRPEIENQGMWLYIGAGVAW